MSLHHPLYCDIGYKIQLSSTKSYKDRHFNFNNVELFVAKTGKKTIMITGINCQQQWGSVRLYNAEIRLEQQL